MGRAEFFAEFIVVAGSLVLVSDDEGNGGSGGDIVFDAGKDFDLIGFLALGGDF